MLKTQPDLSPEKNVKKNLEVSFQLANSNNKRELTLDDLKLNHNARVTSPPMGGKASSTGIPQNAYNMHIIDTATFDQSEEAYSSAQR
jgi:hypothetical protein